MGRMISFSRPDGGSTQGYLAEAGGDRPAVVVIQEWWGLNDQICGVADRFARNGYNALAPDLYQGRVTQIPDEAGHMMDGLDFPGATHQDLRGATRHLKSLSNGRVAVMGYCMGGALTIASAVHVPECDVAVCYYGIPPKEFADASTIKVPFQGHFATQDDWCTPEAVDALGRGPQIRRRGLRSLPLRRRARLLQRGERRLRCRKRLHVLEPNVGVSVSQTLKAIRSQRQSAVRYREGRC